MYLRSDTPCLPAGHTVRLFREKINEQFLIYATNAEMDN